MAYKNLKDYVLVSELKKHLGVQNLNLNNWSKVHYINVTPFVKKDSFPRTYRSIEENRESFLKCTLLDRLYPEQALAQLLGVSKTYFISHIKMREKKNSVSSWRREVVSNSHMIEIDVPLEKCLLTYSEVHIIDPIDWHLYEDTLCHKGILFGLNGKKKERK